MRLLLPILLVGCTRGDGTGEEPDTAPFEVHTDTADTDTGEPATWTDTTLSPAALTVGVGATLSFRLRATSPDGERVTPDGVSWSVDDEAVAEVADGVLTALAEGVVTVSAAFEGGSAEAVVQVDRSGLLEVQVVDAETGGAIEGARVWVGETELTATGADGGTGATGIEGGGIVVTATHGEYVPLTVGPVVGRELVLPLRLRSALEVVPGELAGTADLSRLDPNSSQVAVGLLAAPLPDPPVWTDWDHLVGPSRAVTFFGVEVQLPSNVVVKGSAESWTLPVAPGDHATWGVATVLPLADALAAGAGDEDPVALLASNLERAKRGTASAVRVPSGGTGDAGLVPFATDLAEAVMAEVPDLPAGTGGDEAPVVFGLEADGDRWTVTGLGTGTGSVGLTGTGGAERVIALVQAGGLGSGAGTAVTGGEVYEGTARLAAFPAIPTLPTVDPAGRTAAFDLEAGAQLVRATVYDRKRRHRDLLLPAGDVELLLGDAAALDLGRTTWDLQVLHLHAEHLEALLSTGRTTREALGDEVVAIGFADGEVAGSTP